ncbi:hypothetical protein [Lacticaseibacillus sp. 866-1]|uniref:hypothetical protein n=1 Tax=Lacticaseibacillus sp. 866-1 TaxID=2799576 RepID=UPI0019407FB0|nr:hypothetical protein [Lacticaseibacillus sp. 866-1]
MKMRENVQHQMQNMARQLSDLNQEISTIKAVLADYETQAKAEIATGIPAAVTDGRKALKQIHRKRADLVILTAKRDRFRSIMSGYQSILTKKGVKIDGRLHT